MKLECCLKLEDAIKPQVSFKRFLKCNLFLGILKKSKVTYPQLFVVTMNNTLKYKVMDNIRFIARRDVGCGKATIGIRTPQHQLMINGDSSRLMDFLRLLNKLARCREIHLDEIPILANVKKPNLKVSAMKTHASSVSMESFVKSSNVNNLIQQLAGNYPRLRSYLSQNLQTLEMTCLRNIEIPYLVGRLSLVVVNLENNELRDTDLRWLNEMPIRKSLRKLNLSANKLSLFPDPLIDCLSLDTLNLSRNNIRILPNGISRLQLLRILNLSKNSLHFLPADITRLKLETLDLTYNYLTSNFARRLVQESTPNCRPEMKLTDLAALRIDSTIRCRLSPQDCPVAVLQKLRSLSKCVCGKITIAKETTECYVPLNSYTFSVSSWIDPQNGKSIDENTYLQFHFCSFINRCEEKFRATHHQPNYFRLTPSPPLLLS